MTSNPLTIAGETVTAEDWPEGCPGFECINDPDCGPIWLLRICDPYGRNFYLNYEQREFQQGCRCWFLDKAAEERQIAAKYEQDGAYFGDKFGGMETANYKAWLGAVDKARRYLASAAKWTRISKGVKT